MKGWCPVHDRVFDVPDGDCPECGTALVAVEEQQATEREAVPFVRPDEAPPAPKPEDPAPSSWLLQPTTLAVVVVVAILGAFLVGLDAAGPDAPPTPRFGTPEALAELNVGRLDRGVAGVALRLESFSQRGRRVVMRVTVPPDEPIATGSLQTAQVEFFTPGGGSAGVAAQLPVRPTITGFIVDGVALDRPDITVAAAQIDSLIFSTPAEQQLPVDLDGIWPPDDSLEPRAKRLDRGTRLGDRMFTLQSLVGWPDRLEARFQVRGDRPGWVFDDDFALLIGNVARMQGTIAPTFDKTPGLVHVTFARPPRTRTGPARILLDHDSLTISGIWRWDLGPR